MPDFLPRLPCRVEEKSAHSMPDPQGAQGAFTCTCAMFHAKLKWSVYQKDQSYFRLPEACSSS